MFRKVLMLTAIVLVFSVCNVQADVIHSTWVGGESGMWETASNWNPAIVPDNSVTDTFVVTIDAGAGRVEVDLNQNRTIDTLTCYGNVELEGPGWDWVNLIMDEPNGLINHGVLEITAYGLELFKIHGDVTNDSNAVFDLWGAEIEGDVYNQTQACMEVWGEVNVKGHLENFKDALIKIGTNHELEVDQHLYNAGGIRIYGGGCGGEILDNNSTGEIRGFGVVYGGKEIRNKGTIYANAGSLVIASVTNGLLLNSGVIGSAPGASLHVEHIAPLHMMDVGLLPDVNNFGMIKVNAGGSVVFDSNLNNEPKATMNMLGGTLAALIITQAAGATFDGQGNISTENLVIETDGIIRLTGPTNVFGDVQIDPNATLEISDGTLLITGHTTCNNGTIHMIDGRVICQGGLTNNNCNIFWEPGTYTNMADFNLDGTVNFKDFAYFGDTWLWQADWY
jgi:hypothetical protein